MASRKIFGYTIMSVASIFVASTLLAILIFIFSNGLSGISISYLTQAKEITTGEIHVNNINNGELTYNILNDGVEVTGFNNKIDVETDLDLTSVESIEIKRFDNIPVSYMEDKSVIDDYLTSGEDFDINVTVHKSGILSMIITTLITIFLTLMIALPFSIGTAIYLIEYPIDSRVASVTNFCVNALTAIPSIVYGLFGSFFFVTVLNLGMNILSGCLTMSIMLLPILIRSTQEALLSVDDSLRSASRGLGADEVQTIFKIVLPSAIPGIIVGVILAIGRVIGESAILIFTAGTVDKLTFNVLESSSTLTVKAYMLAKEYGDIAGSASIAVIIILIIICLNLLARQISKKFELGV